MLLVFALLFMNLSFTESHLRLGAVLGLSGVNSYYGTLIKQGIDIARDELKNIKVFFEDSQNNSNEGVKAYKQLVTQRIHAVITAMSIISVPIAPLANQDKIIQFAVLSWANSYSSPDDYTFRLDITTSDAVQAFCEYLSDIRAKNWGIAAVKTVWGTDTKNFLQSKCPVHFAFAEDYLEQERDYSSLVTKFKSKNIEGVLILDHRIASLAELIKRFRTQKFTGEIVYGGGIAQDDTLFRVAGKEAEGTKYVYVTLDEESIIKKFKTKFNQIPLNPYLVALGYEATRILTQIFNDC
ncbi:MAG: ABC transporter substrate-binding protein, partial [Deltaproteobacteria bacterium]|nr:ABC transporter substrate-binding protein [Deltaproteobacteria bacterium]